MSGTEGASMPRGVKTREEMLQEWREQRAARLAGGLGVKTGTAVQQQAGPRPPLQESSRENQSSSRSFAPVPAPKMGDAPPPSSRGVNSIAARLESLKRESLRPSLAGTAGSQAGTQFEAAGPVDTTALRRLAAQLFDDEGWKQLYDRGMHAQLTRSKDGATEDTKIKELAGMVKLLRRALKELQGRTQSFIEQSCRFERDVGQQVEAAKLSSESGAMAANAELANARREAAAAAAMHKNALAAWKGELDGQQAEVARLRRESDRLQAEVARLTGEAKRSEAARAAVEEGAGEARRAAAAAAREAASRQAALERELAAEREAAGKARTAAAADLAAARSAAAEAGTARDGAQARASALDASLAAATAEAKGLAAGLRGATEELEDSRRQLAEQRSVHERVVADAAAVLAELQDWQNKAGDLLEEVGRERGRAAEAEARANSAAAALAAAETAAAAQEARLQGCLAAANQRGDAAESAGEAARADAAAAHSRCESLQGETAALTAELASARGQCEARRLAEESLAADLAAARERAEGLEASAATLRGQREDAAAAAAQAAGKLQRLEGELEALQECTIGLGAGDQSEMLSRLLSRVGALEGAVLASEARRRTLHNVLVELKGNIRVFCRIKPHPRSIVSVGPDGASLRLSAEGKDHAFSYDRVFRPEVGQAVVYEEVADLVQSALDGYKVCLFSYGQTGAGKTHTMQGAARGEGAGVIPRAIRQILAGAEALQLQGWEYSLEASFVEVYNEALQDLLAEGGTRRGDGRIPDSNAIQHQPNGGHTFVAGATRLPIRSEEDAGALVSRAAAARSVESTAMNSASSRSHSVFMLYITGQHAGEGTALHGSLSLVDLAGSERLARSGAEGARARETCSINKSLSALGDVFQALAARAGHVPYRNSKLTHLLQPCLGGSGKTLMFVNVNPEPDSAGETLCSLRFAAKVNAVDTAAKGGATRTVTHLATEITGRPSLAQGEAGAVRGVKRRAAPVGAPAAGMASSRAIRPRIP